MLQANDGIGGIVTDNMKPSTRINKRWVPALQCVVGVRNPLSESIKSLSCKVKLKAHQLKSIFGF